MFGFSMFALVVAIGGLVVSALSSKDGVGKGAGRLMAIVSGAVFLVCLIGACFYVVQPGTVGVEVCLGTVVQYAEAGFRVKNPISHVVRFDCRTIKEDYVAQGASKDLQVVKVECAIQYRIDFKKVGEIFTTVGSDYSDKIIVPGIQDAVKASTALFAVEQIIVARADVRDAIEKKLKEKMEPFNLILQDLQIVNIDFSPEFNKVVEEKQLEEQKIKTAEYRKKQAEFDKQRTILEAEADSRRQELLRASASKEVVELQWIAKWDGHLPQMMMGGNTPMMVNLPGQLK